MGDVPAVRAVISISAFPDGEKKMGSVPSVPVFPVPVFPFPFFPSYGTDTENEAETAAQKCIVITIKVRAKP
jgi:hypothetical protein